MSLATGQALTAETFADFVKRLHHGVRGEGVRDHYTADALFTVQARRIIFGIDRDYSDKTAVCVDESMYFSPQEYWDENEHMRERLDALAHEVDEMPFLQLETYEQWDILDDLPEHTVSGWDERWEHVNSHFTKEAAEAFIKRKKHDYRDGLRVYVEAQIYCWEFNAIIAGLLDGRIGFIEQPADTDSASGRAQRTTIDKLNSAAPVSGTPTSGAVEKAGNHFFNFNVLPTLTKEKEARAENGYCPACDTPNLYELNSTHGMRFCQCEKCKDIVILAAPHPSEAKAGEKNDA